MEFDDVSQLRRRRDREIPLLSFPMTPVNPDVPSKWGHYRQILNDLFSNNSNNTKKRKRSVLYSDRVLDAIGLEDADHLNVLDWNPSILLSIVLDDTVHLWNPNSSADCVLTTGESGGGSVTSVSWAPDGRHIAIGLDNGRIQLWDAEGKRKLRTLMSRSSRIGALAWQGNILTSGGSDGLVIDSDPRLPSSSVVVHTYRGHRRGDICGLEWADSGFKQLASGGRDGLVYIWDSRIEDRWMFRLRAAATGAVRALGWCPFRENLLATGGGVGGDADDDSNGSIKFWNTRTGDCVSSVTTGSSQIANLITKCPILIASNWDKTIKPKFYYLQSAGYSSSDLASLLSSIPHILTASLENRLKPNFELLKSIIGSNKLIASALRQTTRLIQGNLETDFLPNVKTLESCGIPNTSIAKLVGLHPRVILMPNENFKVTVELIREMGFNPLSTMFVHGVAAVSRFNHSTWKKKLGVYKSLGWSQKEVMSAFVRQPFCMLLSEKKIRKAMDFYVKELKWGPSFLSVHPVLLNLSLEKRVMPRCSVTSLLEAEGLMTKSSSVHFLMITEKDFLDKYVIRYKNQIPKLLDAYRADSQKACSEAIL
ncbi:uncharacterized protein A4U43_UnF280 [Asparagus officinalis]|uniref:Anaphase-promoting complex subunit 4-like WD40 domain-containing protein n=1 Tax=Asparagus officinalis TaxID=4686 RepID=A0A1R3L7S8_ASPOF|nr:uncharacterized protein A4U43_UnF280 [Asparagus officinalis]